MGHHTYVFLDDGRRVGFDGSDGTVTVHADGAWRDPFPAGVARPRAGGGWELSDGRSDRPFGCASSRKQAARRIAARAQPQLDARAERRAAQAAATRALDARIVALIRRTLPHFEPPDNARGTATRRPRAA